MNASAKVRVYGSGISGLIVSYYLFKKGCDLEVVDPYQKSILGTRKVEEGIVEQAANSILYNPEAAALLQDIGLDYSLYSDLGKKKYVYLDSKLKRWPLSFLQTLKALPYLWKLMKKKDSVRPQRKESLKAWNERAFNKPLFENLLAVALQGIYGKNTKDLSATLVLDNLFSPKAKSEKKSKTRGSLSFKNGMQDLLDSLRAYLKAQGVQFVEQAGSEPRIEVVSTPAHSLPFVVTETQKAWIAKITYKKIFTLTLFFKEQDRLPFKGFGVVFKNQKNILGLILNSDLFEGRAQKGLASETWILDGSECKEESLALDEILNLRKELLTSKKNVTTENSPKAVYSKYWEKAFPEYNLQLEESLEALSKIEEGPYFFANWTGKIGISSMIQKAPGFVENLLKKEGWND